MEFKDERDAAAWLIKMGRQLLQSNVPISPYISRRHNNETFEMGFRLIHIGRCVAMSYEMGEEWTEAIYKAHIRATRRKE